ncbi:MAG TPA: AsmA family protein, partial [Burkholderiaceae bacterium]|nr:AsmA family protein [Burkholderiaceae bacterium]
MLHLKKIIGATALGLIALLAAILLLVSLVPWNFAKPWISDRVSEATDRSFAINGDLELSWQRPGDIEKGWRAWIPWPHLRAHDLVLGNPQWATTGPTMATVPQVDFNLNPLALFQKTVAVSSLILTEPQLVLELGKDGQ